LNYTKDLNYNAASNVANGVQYASTVSGVPAIGSYWCPPTFYLSSALLTPVASGNQSACDTYGALYTWETAMMLDGKFADETKTSTAWDEAWVSPYYFPTGVPATNNSNRNNARGAVTVNGGGRGICPPDWHIPTEYEWALLFNAVECNTTYTSQPSVGWWGTNAGARLKSQAVFTASDPGDGSWLNDANKGTNTTGFGAVPAGYRYSNGAQFYRRGLHVVYWSSAVGNSSNAWHRTFEYNFAQAHRYLNYRSYGFSVRCVRD
jgi:uncharacterized protein (TIGR02145 family)